MKRRCVIFTLLTLCLSASSICQAEDFTPLFNGRDLDGWVNVNCAPNTWTVENDMIVCTGIPTGVLRTERMYENFVLELDWRHTVDGGNAGLFVHADALPGPGMPFTRTFECQILDNNHGDIFGIGGPRMTPDKPHPKGRALSLPAEKRSNPEGEWNHYRIVSRDGMLTLAVNGEIVTKAYHLNPRKGYICLESEGSLVYFKNIQIKELPGSNPPPAAVAKEAEGFRSLYNGIDLTGWKMPKGSEGHWTAKNWILDYDGKSDAEGEEKHLWSEEEFGDFILIADFKLPGDPVEDTIPVILADGSSAVDEDGEPVTVTVMDAGDSGIYLRGSSEAQLNIWNWPVGSGEIWGYRTNMDLPAEVRRAATPILNADNPVGSWNRFEITCIGEVVTVVLNGKTVLDKARLPGLPKRGPIALQHHGDPVQFANIFVKELD